ncbi:MAG: enoyl-CoA hydratase/isomerase family protein [Desulfobulbus sp.]|nr:enoyl-CoA hydratase/isomerase family protein [Desulfobulbus sp.]
MSTRFRTILFHKKNGLAVITLNRPETLNILDSLMVSELMKVLAVIEQDEEIRAVIMTGGEHCFGAGIDFRDLEFIDTPVAARRYFKQIQILFARLDRLEQPVLAAISGFALGAGLELALACDLRIASVNATFGYPEIKIGMIPCCGGTQRLPRLIGMAKAKELLYTGTRIDAEEAHRLCLVNRIVPSECVLEETRLLAEKIAGYPALALRAAKMAVNGGFDMPLNSAVEYASRLLESLFTSEDQKEGVRAYMEKRKPLYKNR